MTATIERTSPVPYYEQLFEILRKQIQSGQIAPDERLPSELELCRDYGLSRATVRQTLSKLESDGFAHRIPRRGVFVSSPNGATGWTVQEGFLESQIRHGRTGIDTSVVAAGFAPPPDHVGEALELDAGEQVFAIERVRSMNGARAMFSTNWMPGSAGQAIATAAEVLDGTGSVNERLQSAGFVSHGARRVIDALGAPDDVASHLGIAAGTPILRVRSLSWDKTGYKFDYYETWVLTDIIPLEVNVATS